MINKLKQILKRGCCEFIWHTTKIRNQRVVFQNFNGRFYSDNPKAVSEKTHELDPSLELIWINAGIPLQGVPDYIKQVSVRNRGNYYRTLASAKVIVDNFGFSDIPKRKGQKYIQTWHGDRGFKKVLFDSTFVKNLFVAESQPGFCDIAVAGSDYGEKQYRSAFGYNGEVMKVGTPRNDALLHVTDTVISQKKAEFGLDSDVKYLLYAPTYRRNAELGHGAKQAIQGIDIRATLTALERQYGGTWNCLLRAHPHMRGLMGNGVNELCVKDVSEYPDMSDLLILSDALITDYSSSAGDYALLKRPLFLFQDDIDQYIKEDRTFYFEMSDSPYLIAHSQDELNSLIAATSLDAAADNCDNILRFYGTHETGRAALAVAKRILEYCHNETR